MVSSWYLGVRVSDFPENAKVVVIGAGIVGNCLVGHLSDLGWTDIVQIDKVNSLYTDFWANIFTPKVRKSAMHCYLFSHNFKITQEIQD